MEYAIVIMPLSEEDGGGFIGLVPDLPGCVGDGATPTDAAQDTLSAIREWLDESDRLGRNVPEPGQAAKGFSDERNALIATLKVLAQDNLSLESIVGELEERLQVLERVYDSDPFRSLGSRWGALQLATLSTANRRRKPN